MAPQADVDTSESVAEDVDEASELVAKHSVVASEIVAEHNVDASGNVANVEASAVVAKDLLRMTIGPGKTEVEEAVPLYTFLANASSFPNAGPLVQRQFDVCANYAEALLALPQTCKAAPIWLQLPIVSPMRMVNSRFTKQENSVLVLLRPAYFSLREWCFKTETGKTYYITGPIGVGKSHLLYLLVCELSLQRDKFRVSYIHDCKFWRFNLVPYWLQALIMTFSKDLPGLVQNASNILKLTDPEKENSLKELEAEVAFFVEEEKLRWIIVCDQHNALFSEPVVESQLPSSLFSRLSFCATIIISASANNEGFVKRDESWIECDIGIRRFEKNELSMWCDRYLPPISQDLQIQILEATGGIPLELDLFRKSVGATLEQKFENYVTSRQSDVIRIHANYFDKLSPGRKESFTELLASMSLDVAAPINTIGMDRKFMEVVEKDGVRKVVAMTQLYERALYGYHGRLRREWADKFAGHILSGSLLTNDAKGRVIEKLLILALEEKKRFTFNGIKLRSTSRQRFNKQSANDQVSVNISNVVEFDGDGVPNDIYKTMSGTTLFIPKIPNYPGADLIFANFGDKNLTVCQITVTASVIDHMPTSDRKVLEFAFPTTEWAEFSGVPVDKINFLWLAPDECIRTCETAYLQDSMLYMLVKFSALKDLCPAVKFLNLTPKEDTKAIHTNLSTSNWASVKML